ncbi:MULTISPECIES: hypothetical protein [Roseobacteraceae]|uniref:Uncharacterized protein n=2 Tax=Roseobacteraceae TaxID=2854170 RepID=A0A239KW25_9RHOB|nr:MULTISPECIES: hypothetical protein [Roseobacteraceae]SLN75234.1 hypothetical protein ROA7023_03921 [Roseisalinus antarcticus]SNS72733.1 hypothetical protein SAMN04488078_10294 [Antarctobacter heliothermus]SNT21813.1 hypothetical protein SAMN04488078_10723 [Antarctobacter heliothermus]
MKRFLATILTALALPCAAAANDAVVLPCEGRIASAQNTMGPAFQSAFDDVGVRVIGLDIGEPALGWALVMVTVRLVEIGGESGHEACGIVGLGPNFGFSGLYFDTLDLHLSSPSEVILRIDVQQPGNGSGGDFVRRPLDITVNRTTGEIIAQQP